MSATTAPAPSLHVGHLLSIMMLRWLQKTGGKPITLMGGGTTRVGDPSGKDETRRILSIEEIEANKESLKAVFARFLDFGGPHAAIMPDNAEWLAPLNYIDFLRDVGRHFSVNRMLSFEFGEAPARARPGALVPRVQLHDPAGLRFRRASPPPRLRAADGRLRPVGQHRQRHRPRPPHGHRAALRAHLPADHHLLRRQDGQDRAGRGLAERRRSSRPTNTGSSGGTPRTPTSAASCASSPSCRSTRSPGWSGSRAPRSTRRRRCWRPRRRRSCTAGKRRQRPPRRRGKPSRKAAAETRCRRSACRAPSSRRASALPALFVRAGLAGSNSEVRRAVANNSVSINDVTGHRPATHRRRRRHQRRRRGQALARAQEARPRRAGMSRRTGPHPVCVDPGRAYRYSKILRKIPGASAEIGFIVSCGPSSGPNSL